MLLHGVQPDQTTTSVLTALCRHDPDYPPPTEGPRPLQPRRRGSQPL